VPATVSNINLILLPQAAGAGAIHIAVEDFGFAFAPETTAQVIKNLLDERDRIEKSLKDNADRPTAAQLKQYGRRIADALLPEGDVSNLYYGVSSGRIQITLTTADKGLKRVPWEYLVWPDVREGPHANRSLARLVPTSIGGRPAPRPLSARHLRVLLIGADVLGLDRIPWDETKARLEEVFGERLDSSAGASRVRIDMVEGATRTSLKDALQDAHYDIVHFVGHGRPDGILLRGHGNPSGNVLPTQAFCGLLSDRSPALVILSACETANVSDVEPLGTIAESIVMSGVPAVVANQMPISVSVIADFSAALYRSLLGDGNIDCAVNKGRIEVVAALATVNTAAVEWGIPVLYRRAGCSQLFGL
jgi:hypothetical protein